MPYLYFHIWDPRCRHYSRVYTLDGIILKVGIIPGYTPWMVSYWRYTVINDIGVCVCGGVNPCFQGICDFSVFSFSVLRQGVQAAHSVLHQRRHWMSVGDIWPDQSDVPAMRPFRFLNSVIHSQRRPYSICHFLKHVWVQRPFHEQTIINQNEPREQTFCLTSVCENAIPEFWPFENGTTM